MRMDEGLDTGPVLLESKIEIGARETAGSLTDRLAVLGAQAIVEALAGLPSLVAKPQEEARATYAAKVEKQEAFIDWTRAAVELDRQVRAFNPAPCAFAVLEGAPLKVWAAEPAPGAGAPGTVLEAVAGRLVVAAGQGALRLLEVQRPGGRRLAAAEFLRGSPLRAGDKLASAPSPA